jgi:mannose-6-phosphate isomerase-like protein (cupin superfamily)
MKDPIKGPAMVLGPEEGASYWQPAPHSGYMTVKLGPHNLPRSRPHTPFSMGIQVMPAGCHVRAHGHAQNDEVFYILEGTGRCVIDGVTHPLEPGSTVMLGQYCEHSIHNDGPDDMKFVWFFTPPGLEKVIEAAGKPRKAGEPRPETIERPANMGEVLNLAGYATPEDILASSGK